MAKIEELKLMSRAFQLCFELGAAVAANAIAKSKDEGQPIPDEEIEKLVLAIRGATDAM